MSSPAVTPVGRVAAVSKAADGLTPGQWMACVGYREEGGRAGRFECAVFGTRADADLAAEGARRAAQGEVPLAQQAAALARAVKSISGADGTTVSRYVGNWRVELRGEGQQPLPPLDKAVLVAHHS